MPPGQVRWLSKPKSHLPCLELRVERENRLLKAIFIHPRVCHACACSHVHPQYYFTVCVTHFLIHSPVVAVLASVNDVAVNMVSTSFFDILISFHFNSLLEFLLLGQTAAHGYVNLHSHKEHMSSLF